MQAYGFQPVNFGDFHVGNGDMVVIPRNSSYAEPESIPSQVVASRGILAFPIHTGLTTMSIARGSGFYSDFSGPLPYSFGPALSEVYTVLRLHNPGEERPK